MWWEGARRAVTWVRVWVLGGRVWVVMGTVKLEDVWRAPVGWDWLFGRCWNAFVEVTGLLSWDSIDNLRWMVGHLIRTEAEVDVDWAGRPEGPVGGEMLTMVAPVKVEVPESAALLVVAAVRVAAVWLVLGECCSEGPMVADEGRQTVMGASPVRYHVLGCDATSEALTGGILQMVVGPPDAHVAPRPKDLFLHL